MKSAHQKKDKKSNLKTVGAQGTPQKEKNGTSPAKDSPSSDFENKLKHTAEVLRELVTSSGNQKDGFLDVSDRDKEKTEAQTIQTEITQLFEVINKTFTGFLDTYKKNIEDIAETFNNHSAVMTYLAEGCKAILCRQIALDERVSKLEASSPHCEKTEKGKCCKHTRKVANGEKTK